MRWQIAGYGFLITLVFAGFLAIVAGETLRQLNDNVIRGRILADAEQLASQIDRATHERWREVKFLATFAGETFVEDKDVRDRLRRTLESAARQDSTFSWIGVADTAGVIRVATEGVLEGKTVAGHQWFERGLKGAHVEDFHEAVLLALLMSQNDPGSFRLFDISAPVHNSNGTLVGVLGSHLSWTWVDRLRIEMKAEALLPALEIFVVEANGRVIIGSDVGHEPFTSLDSLPHEATVLSANGRNYWVATVDTKGTPDFPGLGWKVLVRVPVEAAQDLSAGVTWKMPALFALVVMLLLVWAGSGLIAAPVQRLMAHAKTVASHSAAFDLPHSGGSRETSAIRLSMRSIVRNQNKRLEGVEAERDHDFLTGVFNRRGFFAALADTADRPCKHCNWFVVVDIDHFKSVNDGYGHAVGDEVLKSIAGILATQLGPHDLVGRVGGEEFVLRLFDLRLGQAVQRLEVLRAAIEQCPIAHDQRRIYVTASFGVAAFSPDRSVQETFDLADAALYDAKTSGRNKVVISRQDKAVAATS